jgi:hypothetical protein
MSRWSERAREAIRRAHETVPEDATLQERMKIVDAAYPFGQRELWPYKAWLKARKSYLQSYGYKPKPKTPTPLFDCTCDAHSKAPHKPGCPMHVEKAKA